MIKNQKDNQKHADLQTTENPNHVYVLKKSCVVMLPDPNEQKYYTHKVEKKGLMRPNTKRKKNNPVGCETARKL